MPKRKKREIYTATKRKKVTPTNNLEAFYSWEEDDAGDAEAMADEGYVAGELVGRGAHFLTALSL